MSILTLLVVLVVVGFALWLVTTYVPMPQPYKQVVVVIIALLVLIWAVTVLFSGGVTVRIP